MPKKTKKTSMFIKKQKQNPKKAKKIPKNLKKFDKNFKKLLNSRKKQWWCLSSAKNRILIFLVLSFFNSRGVTYDINNVFNFWNF